MPALRKTFVIALFITASMLLSAVLLQPIFFVLVAHYQRLPVEWLLWGLGLSITVGMSVSLVAGIFLLIEFLMRRFWPTKRS